MSKKSAQKFLKTKTKQKLIIKKQKILIYIHT